MDPIPQATLGDKLGLIPKIGYVLWAALAGLITRPFTSANRPSSTFKDVFYTMLRTHLGELNVAQEQWMLRATTADVYRQFVESEKLKLDSTTLESGLQIHWFGGQTAQKTILFFHGGGYVTPVSVGHLRFVSDLQKDLSKTSTVNVAMLGYTLAPKAQYPTQLKQAVEALHWLLEVQKMSPRDIVIAGDSAGGNLALALMLHILHPHPDIQTVIRLQEPLLGGILISPWINFSSDYDSIKRNASSDLIAIKAGTRWSNLFMGAAKTDNYNQPFFADASWLKGLNEVVQGILIWAGSGELLVDSIDGLAKNIQSVHPHTEYVVEPGAGHDDFIIELLLGPQRKAEGTKMIEKWLAQRL